MGYPSYPQYTTPVRPPKHSDTNQYVRIALAALLAGGGTAFFVAASSPSSWVCWVIVGELTATAGILAYCDWWLNDRLIGLPTMLTATDYTSPFEFLDQSAIGVIVSIDQPGSEPFPGNYDTDFTFNLLLQGNDPGTHTTNPPYGYLMQEHTAIRGLDLPFTGNEASYTQPGFYLSDDGDTIKVGKTITSAVLHVEIEGAGVADVQKAATIAFGIEWAALALCLLLSQLGPWGEIAAAILAILAFLFGALGGLSYKDKASSDDIKPLVGGELHSLDDHDGGADIVMVTGSWVYDAGHNNQDKGWNELHPVKAIQRIGKWSGSWTPTPGLTTFTPEKAGRYIELQKEATSSDTIREQQEPTHYWRIHPYLDGCGVYPPIEPPASAPPTLR